MEKVQERNQWMAPPIASAGDEDFQRPFWTLYSRVTSVDTGKVPSFRTQKFLVLSAKNLILYEVILFPSAACLFRLYEILVFSKSILFISHLF